MPLLLSMSLGLWIFNITLMGVWALSICMFLYIVRLDVAVLPTFWDLELMQSVSKFWVLSLIYAHLPILLLLDQWICQLIRGLFAEKGGKQRSDDVFVNDLRLYCYVFFNDFFGLITWVCLFFFLITWSVNLLFLCLENGGKWSNVLFLRYPCKEKELELISCVLCDVERLHVSEMIVFV